ncbi:1751_t:CDS:2, partial [Acaulospora colombiana]
PFTIGVARTSTVLPLVLMDPAKKRSASQANLAFANRPTKRRQAPRQPSSQPFSLSILSLPSQARVLDLAGSAFAYMSKALNAEPTPINREDGVDVDIPGSFPARNPSALANGEASPEKKEESGGEDEEGDDQDESLTYQREMSEVLTQTHDSSDGSPVPDTPLQSKAGSSSPMRDMSVYGTTFASERSTPLSTSPRKGAIRKPVLKVGFRHHAHPLKKQHELEQRMKHTKELFLLKRARGYSQDLSTFRGELSAVINPGIISHDCVGYMSYREHLEAFLAATDKKLIPRFSTSELLAKRNKERDEEIERRLRPKLPDFLPPEDEQKVKQSLTNKSFLAKVAREQVTAQDLSRLRPGQWLNDEIINLYGAMISERAAKFEEAQSQKQAFSEGTGVNGYGHSPNGKGKSKASNGLEGIGEPWKVHVFNTYFMSKLQEMGYEKSRLNKWTKKDGRISLERMALNKRTATIVGHAVFTAPNDPRDYGAGVAPTEIVTLILGLFW